MVQKILILMSDTGGGHRASAEALRDAFAERYGHRFQVEMLDLWIKHTPPPLNQVPKTYRFLVDDAPWLYKFVYEVGENPQVMKPLLKATATFLQPILRPLFEQHDPDVVISVHPLMQEIPERVLARMARPVPFVTVVTDLITIPLAWFTRRATLCFVPSDEGRQLAWAAGLPEDRLRQFGLPIRPAFACPPRPQRELRQELGMALELPAALIVSGGEGMGPVGEIAAAAARRLAGKGEDSKPAGQLAVICGRNEELYRELSGRAWPVPMVVRGFVEDIWDWMAACDCIVTKAGPGTIAEALALSLPILLSGYVPGQESGNVPYVLKYGVGAYVEDPWQIAEVIGGWFGPQRDVLEQMVARARHMGHPDAAFHIVDEIVRLLDGAPLAPPPSRRAKCRRLAAAQGLADQRHSTQEVRS